VKDPLMLFEYVWNNGCIENEERRLIEHKNYLENKHLNPFLQLIWKRTKNDNHNRNMSES